MTESNNLITEFNHTVMHINTIVYIYNYINTHNSHKTKHKSLIHLELINSNNIHYEAQGLCYILVLLMFCGYLG